MKEMENQNSMNYFHNRSHFWGRLTISAAIIASLTAPLYMFLVVGAFPGWQVLINGIIGYAGFIGIAWFLEPITYYPILGTAGTYMAFLSGNISNLCLPCSAAAQEAANAEPGTPKAEISGVLGIAMANFVNKIIITITLLGGVYIISILPENILSAFEYILPAIFGSVLGQFAIKKPLYGLIGLGIGFIVVLSPIPSVVKIAVAVGITIAIILFIEKSKNKDN